ncbi:hybrid sensor histidine kinase/response regulator [Paludibaculum fermentans]|uniref:Sensory/regulatory protein RpfC n=1 Tax=Paludibaculum fermentans TaxID=1473598 RepID=A0A7S7NVV9_PALFE|nr:hybrid sensor histidine kinase/response regulator [Paludibaculum fermentans]QOY90703.1 response regulator [Paludibaculum fermentans]
MARAPKLRDSILIAALLVPSLQAQRYSFKTYGQEQGLSNLATECLFQDRTGYLWVGTQNGLFRYDGAVFARFGEADGLPSSTVDSIVESSDGVLWVATSHGLARRRGSRFEAFAFKQSVESAGRFGLASDATGRLYLTTNAGILQSSQPAGGAEPKFEPIPGQPSGHAYGVHVEQGGVIWYGCGSGVCRIENGRTESFGQDQGVPADRWDALLTDREGTVWIRSSKRLLLKQKAGTRFSAPLRNIPSNGDFATLAAGKDGELFVPTDDGVWEFAHGQWRVTGQEQGLIAAATSAVLQDREGSLWIGLWGTGLSRWVGRNEWEGWTRAEGLSGEHVWKMARDLQGQLWVATDNGLNQMRMDARTGKVGWRLWTEANGLAANKTRSLALGPDGALWAGSSPGGISRIQPVTGQVQTFALPRVPGSDRIWTLTFDKSGRLWAATRGGLFSAVPLSGKTEFQKQELPNGDAGETVSTVLEDRQGRFWAAGTRGLARRENGVWRRFTKQDGLASTAAGFLAEGADGSIWVGYRDRSGVSQVKVDGERLSVKTFTPQSGLHSGQAIFVKVDRRGWVWFGTDQGIDVLIGKRWHHFGRQDGLIWDDCNTDAFFEDNDGSVWIGTSRGMAHYRVPVSRPALDGPRVEFTRFQLGDRTPDLDQPIVEPYRNRTLSAQLSVLTFLAEGDVLCRYRLVGLDDDWLETKQREVRFPNLPPGRYVLEATARNAAGIWSKVTAQVRFTIQPPWWGTWWFRTVIVLTILLVLAAVILWRTRRLLSQSARLEAAVKERTQQLRIEQDRIVGQNAEIERLLEQARQANLLKDEFLANMSHEIRTPMNGIIGMINVTLAQAVNAEQQESLHMVKSCAQSLLHILNDILDFSKIEAGKLEIAAAPFRLRELMEGACATFLAVAREKGIRLTWDIARDVPEWLECDERRIRQVLLNLIGNALKFTHEGEVHVAASAEASDGGSLELHFAVSDTGIGIPEAARALIFEAFRQADGTTSRNYGGTGLGLTISSRLVHLMGGRIQVDSDPGRGSTFRFWVHANAVAARPEPVPASSSETEGVTSSPLHILLAEDNVVNQRVAVALLKKRGHAVEVVNNGRQAVERSESRSFDRILMDLQMPEMDGWTATQLIRERERITGCRVPILALTAHAMNHVQQRCLEIGMDAVIVKPFDPVQFYRTLEQEPPRPLSTGSPECVQSSS